MCRYLAEVFHIAEPSRQPIRSLAFWRNFSSKIIHPWCDCWWISTAMLTKGSVVSVSCWSQTVMGEACFFFNGFQMCGWVSIPHPTALIWENKESNRLYKFFIIWCLCALLGVKIRDKVSSFTYKPDPVTRCDSINKVSTKIISIISLAKSHSFLT